MADLPLIAWADVPEGHYVWFRIKAVEPLAWQHGLNYHGTLLDQSGRPFYGTDAAYLEFARAEQQPGDYARPEATEDDPLTAARLDSIRKRWKQAEAKLTALRDGLAALEQETQAALDTLDDADPLVELLTTFIKRLAALLEEK